MISVLLAASVSFTAVATGLEKGAPVEFAFVGTKSDRDYEAMFQLEEPIDGLCRKIEEKGLLRGKSVDPLLCRLWPVGCRVRITPALSEFIDGKMPEGLPQNPPAIYTGGARDTNGVCVAQTTMPASFFALYSLAQSPIVFDGIFEQGAVYGSFTAKKKLEKGTRCKFTIEWETELPERLVLTAAPGRLSDLLGTVREAAAKGPVELQVGFHDDLTVREATAFANALSVLDSTRVKINGCSNVFYRSFQPLVKWRDRQQRLVQPFELTLGETNRLVQIEEDWTVEGPDPKLTPKEISFADASKYPKTDTCFIFASEATPIKRIVRAMSQLRGTNVRNWYVFTDNPPSLHNTH